MTDRQIEVLRMSINGVHFYDDLDGPDRGVLVYLEQEGYVYTKALDPPIYFIKQKGLAKLKELDDKANQESEEKRQKRFENKISVLNVLIPILTFFVGIIVEHFSGFIDTIVSWMQG